MNYRCAAGEMDVIAEEADHFRKPTLVFPRSETRRGAQHGSPREGRRPTRKQHAWPPFQRRPFWEEAPPAGGEEPACRFDIVEVFVGGRWPLSRVVLPPAPAF